MTTLRTYRGHRACVWLPLVLWAALALWSFPPGTAAADGKDRKSRTKSEPQSSAQQRARKAIRSGDFDLARALLRSGMKSRSRSERNAWHIVEAELEYEAKNYAKAALVAMRIVILHPRSKQVGPALFWAGQAYEGIGRPKKSIELYEACLEHETTRRSIRQKTEKRLEALKEPSSEP